MAELKFRVEDQLLEAIKTTAAQKGVSEAELCRRYLRRQLGLEAAHSSVAVIQEAIRGLLREELSPIRRLAFIGAFESTAAHQWSKAILGQSMTQRTPASRDEAFKVIEREEASARSVAAARSREAHPEREAAPPEGLPEADETFDLSPADAALFKEGGD